MTTTPSTRSKTAAHSLTAARPDGLTSKLAYLARVLKTPTIGRVWEDLADQARDANWSHEEYLAAVLERQVADRESAGNMMRVRTAHFPAIKTLEDFNLEHLPSLRTRMPRITGGPAYDPRCLHRRSFTRCAG